MSIRITKSYVTDMAKHVEEFTGGAFQLGHISNPGDGRRYSDGILAHTWFSPREAAAYYMGAMLGWARETGTEIPSDVMEFCRPMRDLVAEHSELHSQQEWGVADARYRAESRRMH